MVTGSRLMLGMVIFMLALSSANASRFTYTEVDDPFSDGVCLKPEMLSFTSREILEGERFGISWPKGSLSGIVLCNSGFVYFSGDADLSDDEEFRVREFLEKISWIDFSDVWSISPELLVWLLEETYKRREVDSRFWFEFHQAIAKLGPELEALRKARVSKLFRTQYRGFQDDAKIHYLMSGFFARDRLMPEACEALYLGDQIMSTNDSVLSDMERAKLSDYRAYAVADLLSSEDVQYGKIRLSDCNDLRKENEHVPDREDP